MRHRLALYATLFAVAGIVPASAQSTPRFRNRIELRDDWRFNRRPMTGSYRIRINPRFQQDIMDRAMDRAARARVLAEDRVRMADRIRTRVNERKLVERRLQLDRGFDLRERGFERSQTAIRRQMELRERVMDRLQNRMQFRFDDRFRIRSRHSRII